MSDEHQVRLRRIEERRMRRDWGQSRLAAGRLV